MMGSMSRRRPPQQRPWRADEVPGVAGELPDQLHQPDGRSAGPRRPGITVINTPRPQVRAPSGDRGVGLPQGRHRGDHARARQDQLGEEHPGRRRSRPPVWAAATCTWSTRASSRPAPTIPPLPRMARIAARRGIGVFARRHRRYLEIQAPRQIQTDVEHPHRVRQCPDRQVVHAGPRILARRCPVIVRRRTPAERRARARRGAAPRSGSPTPGSCPAGSARRPRRALRRVVRGCRPRPRTADPGRRRARREGPRPPIPAAATWLSLIRAASPSPIR